MTLRLTDVSALALDARAARLRTGRITVQTDGGTRLRITGLARGTEVLVHHHVVARAGRNGIATVKLRKGTTVLVLVRSVRARAASVKPASRRRTAPSFTA